MRDITITNMRFRDPAEDIREAAEQLAKSQRGQRAMHALLKWVDEWGIGLDAQNQSAVLTLLAAAWGPLTGTTRDAMRDLSKVP